PAAAQWLGMPTWNSAKGGTGVTFYGDYGAPNDSAGKGHAFGGRAALGVGTITLTAGVASWKPGGQTARATSYGGPAAFRVIGGNFSFGLVGIHVAYDSEKFDNGTHGVLGVGADVGLRLPMGL